MYKVRDEKTKKKFIAYLKANPELRFWQAIRNFWGVGFVYISDELCGDRDISDTYYIEADEARKEKNAKSNID